MAAVLKLVRGGTEIDLLNGDDGIYLARDGWVPGVGQYAYGSRPGGLVAETMSFEIEGTSNSNLATKLTAIDDMVLEMRQRDDDPVSPDPTWLQAQLDGESGARRAYVHQLSLGYGSNPFATPTRTAFVLPHATLGIERKPFWEDTSYDSFTPGAIGQEGDLVSVGSSTGTAPGRVWETRVFTNIAANAMTELWWGFRTNRYGARGDFEPVWEFSGNGTALNNASDNGTSIVWDGSGTTTMLPRASMLMDQIPTIGGEYAAQRGTHLVLLLARNDSADGRTFYCRLAEGYSVSNTGEFNTHDPVEVTIGGHANFYNYYVMGTVTIGGPRDTTQADAHLRDYYMRIEAELGDAGTGNLYLNRLVLIPQIEGAAHVKGTQMSNSYNTYLYTEADERNYIRATDGTNVQIPSVFSTTNYYMPAQPFSLIFAGQGTSVDIANLDSCFLSFYYYPRWASLRS